MNPTECGVFYLIYCLIHSILYNMKKVFLIFLIFLCSCTPKYHYRIVDERGDVYFCNFFNKTTDGCVMFNDKPGYDNTPGFPTRLCGDYTIKELK